MKILKILLFIVVALFGIYVVLCAMGPKKMAVTKSQLINASPESVFEEISDFSKWSAWSPWYKLDPNMASTIVGNPGEVGHGQSWKSEHKFVGNGSQKFVEVRPNEYIKSEMKLMGEDDTPSHSDFTLKPEGEGTMLTWSMDGGDVPFMARGMMKVFGFEKMLGEQFDSGLKGIKEIAEAKPKATSIVFEVVDITDQWYVGQRFTVNQSKIDATLFGNSYGAITKFLGGQDKVTGPPFSIAHNYDPNSPDMDLEIALPVAAQTKTTEGITCAMIPGGKAAKYVYHGPYEGTGPAWGALMEAVNKSHKPRWSGYEVYVNDPATVKSPSELETWLIIPIE